MVTRLAICLLAFIVLSVIYASQTFQTTSVDQSALVPLSTEGNRILNSRTGEPVLLRGVVSDYFRYGANWDYPARHGGLEAELERLQKLKDAGAKINMVGLYLSDLTKIKANIEEMDRYIQYAGDNGIYVYLAPVGHHFIETGISPADGGEINPQDVWDSLGSNDLAELTELIASRYGNYPNVIYQLAAEPDIGEHAWEDKQRELSEIVRRYSDNLIMASTPYYSPYLSLPALASANIIYSTGGYVRKNDKTPPEREINAIQGEERLKANYPVIVVEFGGNYGGNFSSPEDLEQFPP